MNFLPPRCISVVTDRTGYPLMSTGTALANYTSRTMSLAKAILAQEAQDRDFMPEDALVDVGLSSLDLVNLMIAVEAEFDIMIPASQLNPANFHSIVSIARMVSAVDAPPNG